MNHEPQNHVLLQDCRFIVENSGDIIAFHRAHGGLRYVSPSVHDVLGFSEQELYGRHFRRFIHADDYPYVQRSIEEKLQSDSNLTLHYRLRRRNGEYIWVESKITKMKDSHLNGDARFLSITRDISFRKEEQQTQIEHEKLTIVGQLAAGIAHEIRNPLTTLKGFLQIMEQEQTYKNDYVRIMKDEINRIEAIAGEMLYLGKPANDQRQACSMLDITNEVIALLLPESNLKNTPIAFTNELEADAFIFCNKVHIKQVLINTIKNAMDASESNGVVEVKLQPHADRVRIVVIDHGCGIHPDDLGRLGQPFFTTKENGTGLGLLISYNIVQEHQGTIHVDSRINEGTTFTIELPVLQRYTE